MEGFQNMEVLKVSAKSNPNAVAEALAGCLEKMVRLNLSYWWRVH